MAEQPEPSGPSQAGQSREDEKPEGSAKRERSEEPERSGLSDQRLATGTRTMSPFVRLMMQRMNSPHPRAGKRNPMIDTDRNTADKIERWMQSDYHRKWGFVIYRSTYDNEEDWEEFMRRLRLRTHEHLDHYGGLDLLESLEFTVLSDPSLFDEAPTDVIRRHFQRWSLATWRSEQLTPLEGEKSPDELIRIAMGRSVRYRMAIQVDKESLQSVINEVPDPLDLNPEGTSYVKLIDKTWYLGRGLPSAADDERTPIEGVTQVDVGWMKVSFKSLVSHYDQFCGQGTWSLCYVRPPRTYGPDDYYSWFSP